MDTDTFEWLTRLISESLSHKTTNDWERGFLKDQLERMDNYGTSVFFSTKQWNAIIKIARKIEFEEPPSDDRD